MGRGARRWGIDSLRLAEAARAARARARAHTRELRRRHRRRARRARARGPPRGRSLRCGLDALPEAAEAGVVVLGDGPDLNPKAIDRVIAAWRAQPAEVVAAT